MQAKSVAQQEHVLNASRHHRCFHARARAQKLGLDRCSTPRGITGTFTWPAKAGYPMPLTVLNASRHHRYFHVFRVRTIINFFYVLNASRHHRYFHVPLPSGGEEKRRCSTPRGITGTFTICQREFLTPGYKCSTPRGITGTFTPVVIVAVESLKRCSTPRGITGTFTGRPHSLA